MYKPVICAVIITAWMMMGTAWCQDFQYDVTLEDGTVYLQDKDTGAYWAVEDGDEINGCKVKIRGKVLFLSCGDKTRGQEIREKLNGYEMENREEYRIDDRKGGIGKNHVKVVSQEPDEEN